MCRDNTYFIKVLILGIITIFAFFQRAIANDYNTAMNQALDEMEARQGDYLESNNVYGGAKNSNSDEEVSKHKESIEAQVNNTSLEKGKDTVHLPSVKYNSSQNKEINSLDADGMDIDDLLHEIAARGGFNIVIADNVSGKVTLHLNKIHPLEAIRIVVGLNGFAFFKKDNTIYVVTADDFKSRYGYSFDKDIKVKAVRIKYADASNIVKRLEKEKGKNGRVIYCADSKRIIIEDNPIRLNRMLSIVRHMDVPMETEAFILQYVAPETIIDKVRTALTRDVGRVHIDRSTNSIVVTDTVLGMKKIESLIKSLDKQDKEVHVVAKILQVVLDDEYSTGIDWEAIVSDYKSLSFPGFGEGKGKNIGKLSFGTVNAEDFAVLLDALDTVGIIRDIAKKDILLSEGQSADIIIDEDVLSLISKRNKKKIDSTIKKIDFSLSPTISDKDMVIMEITPKIIGRREKAIIGVNRGKQRGSVMVAVGNGATVVIGGLIKKEMFESMHKIPLLGDIPLLGRAFRSQARRLRNTEVIVFLTTSVVIKDKDKGVSP